MADNPFEVPLNLASPRDQAKRGAVFTNRPELKGKENVVFTPDYDYWVSGETKGGAPQPEPGSMRPEFTDINEFENHVHEIIGGNPLEINPIDDANSAMEDLPNYFNQIFKGVAIWQDRDKLGPKHAAIWQQFVNAYRSKVYNESKQRKAQMMDMKNAMMNKFKYQVDAYNDALERVRKRDEAYKKDMIWIYNMDRRTKKKVHRSLVEGYLNKGWTDEAPISTTPEKVEPTERERVNKEIQKRIVNVQAGKEDNKLIEELQYDTDVTGGFEYSLIEDREKFLEEAREWKVDQLRKRLKEQAAGSTKTATSNSAENTVVKSQVSKKAKKGTTEKANQPSRQDILRKVVDELSKLNSTQEAIDMLIKKYKLTEKQAREFIRSYR